MLTCALDKQNLLTCLGCGPLRNTAIGRDSDQALFLLQASVYPPYLPHWVAVLPAAGTAAQAWHLLSCHNTLRATVWHGETGCDAVLVIVHIPATAMQVSGGLSPEAPSRNLLLRT